MKNAKMRIQKQLIELMKSQSIHTIKVNNLTNSLGIGRSTFYLYYNSIFSVLQDIEDEFFDELQTIATTFWSYPPNSHYLNEPHPIILKVMIFLKSKKDIGKVLWGPYGDHTFRIRCRKMIKNAFYPKHIFPPSENNSNTIYEAAFVIGGHLELVNCWMDNDCSLPPEELTLLIYKLMYSNYK